MQLVLLGTSKTFDFLLSASTVGFSTASRCSNEATSLRSVFTNDVSWHSFSSNALCVLKIAKFIYWKIVNKEFVYDLWVCSEISASVFCCSSWTLSISHSWSMVLSCVSSEDVFVRIWTQSSLHNLSESSAAWNLLCISSRKTKCYWPKKCKLCCFKLRIFDSSCSSIFSKLLTFKL